jgi:membrane protease YdiL (CAAX protease family)
VELFVIEMNLKSGRLRSIWTIFWKSAVFICLWGMLYTPFIVAFKDRIAQQGKSFSPQIRLYVEAAGALTVLAAAWIMVRFIDRRPFRTLGFARGYMVHDFLIGMGIGTAWLGLSLIALWIMGCVSMRSSFTVLAPSLVWAAAALLLNTVTQEVLVRSYIYQTIKSQSNFIWAIAGSSILFMLLHAGALAGAWLPALNLFLAGVFFGVAYHQTGNLWLPIAIHFTWNFMMGPVAGLTVSGQNELNRGWQLMNVQGPALLTGGPFGMEGGLIVTLTTAMGATAMYCFIRRDELDAASAQIRSRP